MLKFFNGYRGYSDYFSDEKNEKFNYTRKVKNRKNTIYDKEILEKFENLFCKAKKLARLKRVSKKNLQSSLELNKIINEQYKEAMQNKSEHFLTLYRGGELANENLKQYFKEGAEEDHLLPSYMMKKIINLFISLLFFVKYLNNTFNEEK